jgi:hypothetical protein
MLRTFNFNHDNKVVPVHVNAVKPFKNVIKDLSALIGIHPDSLSLKKKNGLLLSDMHIANDSDAIYYKFGTEFDVVKKKVDIIMFEFNIGHKGKINIMKFPALSHAVFKDVLEKIRKSLDLIVDEFKVFSILNRETLKKSDTYSTAKEIEIKFGNKFMARMKTKMEKPVGQLYKLRIQMVESQGRHEMIQPVLGNTFFKKFLENFCKSRNINPNNVIVSIPLDKPFEKIVLGLEINELCKKYGNTFEFYEPISTEKMNEFSLSMKIVNRLINVGKYKRALNELGDIGLQFPKNDFPDHQSVLESKRKLIDFFIQIEKAFAQNTQILISQILSVGGYTREKLLDLMMEWTGVFEKYKIEGECLVIKNDIKQLEDSAQHLNSVDTQFEDWELKEITKDGKIE